MSKFNVGDEVYRYRDLTDSLNKYFRGWPFKIAAVNLGGTSIIDPEAGCHSAEYLLHVAETQEAGPVRTETVTRKVIVPGVYGRAEVDSVYDGGVNLKFRTTFGSSSGIWTFSASELRSLGRLAISLAEALEQS